MVKVTGIARGMVTRYGMVKALGDVAYEEERTLFLDQAIAQTRRDYSEETAREIDLAALRPHAAPVSAAA